MEKTEYRRKIRQKRKKAEYRTQKTESFAIYDLRIAIANPSSPVESVFVLFQKKYG